MIEQLIGQKIELQALPERLEISDVLLDEEKIQTANIIYQKGRPKGGGAFHARSAKNSKSPEKKKKSSIFGKLKKEIGNLDFLFYFYIFGNRMHRLRIILSNRLFLNIKKRDEFII